MSLKIFGKDIINQLN